MNKSIIQFIKENNYEWDYLGKDIDRDFSFIESLYTNEQDIIFEHSSFHVLSYLAYRRKLIAVKANGFSLIIAIGPDDAVFIFTPKIEHEISFSNFIVNLKKYLDIHSLDIQNISEQLLGVITESRHIGIESVTPRSREEVIYDVEKILFLKGSLFSGLRNANNKLLKSNRMTFLKATTENIQDAFSVLNIWSKHQGKKYKKNKEEKERFVIDKFTQFNSMFFKPFFSFEIGYLDGNPLSICAMYQSSKDKDWGTFYFIKGLNTLISGGMHGVSDATYLHCFRKAHELGIRYINDGELGSEEGTRNHKLSFSPVHFLKSFDITV